MKIYEAKKNLENEKINTDEFINQMVKIIEKDYFSDSYDYNYYYLQKKDKYQSFEKYLDNYINEFYLKTSNKEKCEKLKLYFSLNDILKVKHQLEKVTFAFHCKNELFKNTDLYKFCDEKMLKKILNISSYLLENIDRDFIIKLYEKNLNKNDNINNIQRKNLLKQFNPLSYDINLINEIKRLDVRKKRILDDLFKRILRLICENTLFRKLFINDACYNDNLDLNQQKNVINPENGKEKELILEKSIKFLENSIFISNQMYNKYIDLKEYFYETFQKNYTFTESSLMSPRNNFDYTFLIKEMKNSAESFTKRLIELLKKCLSDY